MDCTGLVLPPWSEPALLFGPPRGVTMRLRSIAAVLFIAVPVAVRAQEHTHPAGAARDTLGAVHFATSCSSGVASRFDRAVALLHSFEFGESIRTFTAVLAADSTCAMAHWGIALSRWTNPMTPGNRAPA